MNLLLMPQVFNETFESKWIEGLTNEEYHADKTAVSASGICLALQSPRAFYRKFILGKSDQKESKAMNFGSMVHLALLEPERFRGLYKIMPKFVGRTKDGRVSDKSAEAKEKKEAWLKDQPRGAVILDEEDYERIMCMIESVMAHDRGLVVQMLKNCVFEKSGYFRDPITGLKCRFRPDILRQDLSILADLKTTRDASRNAFSRAIYNYQYYVQMAFYSFGIEQIHGKRPQVTSLIAVENQEPYDVSIHECSDGMLERGMMEVRKGLNRIKQCIDDNVWPGVQPNGAETIDLPVWSDAVWDGVE